MASEVRRQGVREVVEEAEAEVEDAYDCVTAVALDSASVELGCGAAEEVGCDCAVLMAEYSCAPAVDSGQLPPEVGNWILIAIVRFEEYATLSSA